MMNSILFFMLLLAILMLPGTAFINVLRLRGIEVSYRFLISVSFSYGVFSLIIAIARVTQFSFDQLSNVVFASLLASLLILVASFCRFKRSLLNSVNLENLPIIIIVIILGIYHLQFGAYTEIPADIYYHIEKFRRIQESFLSGDLSPISSVAQAFKQDIEVWYHLLALVVLQTNVSTGQAVQTASLLSQCLFLIAVFEFSKRIFSDRVNAEVIALLATLLVAIHMGITAFSYLRYYALAPGMLGFVLYFTAIVVFWDLLIKRSFEHFLSRVSFLAFILLAAVLIHTQEAMFIMILCSVMICIFAVCIVLGKEGEPKFQVWQRSGFDRFAFLIALLVVFVFTIAYVFLHNNFVHFGNNGNRLWEFGPAIGLLPQLSILNPSYQFMQVVTAWGLLVYVLFFCHWQRYKHNLFLISGMLLPLFTVFNPFFTDLFLRLTDSTVLWRFCFLIPIHYVAADLILHYLQSLFTNSDLSDNESKTSRLFMGAALVSLLVFLAPLMNGWKGLHHSRYPTLKAVNPQQSYQHLSDAIDFLENIPNKKVLLTDPVTGYVLSGFTKHNSFRDKFFINEYSGFKKFTFDSYADNPLQKYSDHLLVINERTVKNGDSFVGAVTRHWPTDLFQRIQPFYTSELKRHISANPEKFSLLFEKDNFAIYLLK